MDRTHPVVYPSRLAEINRYVPPGYKLDVGSMGFFSLHDAFGDWVEDFGPSDVAENPRSIVEAAWRRFFDRDTRELECY